MLTNQEVKAASVAATQNALIDLGKHTAKLEFQKTLKQNEDIYNISENILSDISLNTSPKPDIYHETFSESLPKLIRTIGNHKWNEGYLIAKYFNKCH